MWAGVNIEELKKSIYGNFYTPADYAIINGNDEVTLDDVKRLINKAKKIGDSVTESLLAEMYDELLYRPPVRAILPPREVLKQRYEEILHRAEQQLWGKK